MGGFNFRQFTLGDQFQPKMQDIPTPDLFTALGAPDDLLRLVGISASNLALTEGAFGKDAMLNSALLVCAVLRYRDQGGDDGRGTPVYAMTDAPLLAGQDSDLLSVLGPLAKKFLGYGPVAAQVDAAKNDSGAALSTTGGSALPLASDIPPSAPVSE
jgi:hypothetical protein